MLWFLSYLLPHPQIAQYLLKFDKYSAGRRIVTGYIYSFYFLSLLGPIVSWKACSQQAHCIACPFDLWHNHDITRTSCRSWHLSRRWFNYRPHLRFALRVFLHFGHLLLSTMCQRSSPFFPLQSVKFGSASQSLLTWSSTSHFLNCYMCSKCVRR